MLRVLILFILKILIIGQAYSQVSISGKVLNDISGEPLVGASVYINNSTIGSTTAADGSYSLPNVMPGTYDIIVTYVSYEAIIQRISVADQPLRFTFRMNERIVAMRNILLMSDEMRRKRLEKFRELFLGITLAGERSRILNEDDILFEGNDKSSVITAFSEQPLIVENRELGYRIYFDLKEFFLDEAEGRSYFLGYSRYEDLEKGGAKDYTKKRLQYYLGSTMHFYQSLSAGTAEKNDYRIYSVQDIKGNQRKLKVQVQGDSIIYFDPVRQQKFIEVPGSLIVDYLKDPYHKSHLKSKVFLDHASRKGIESTIFLLEHPCYLDRSGLLENPMSVQYSGFWGYEKLANMLPVDYKPPAKATD